MRVRFASARGLFAHADTPDPRFAGPTACGGPRVHFASARGFTLIELMISLVLFSFAIAGTLSIAVSLTNGYREQRQAVETEMSVRAPMDFLSDAIRSAVPGISLGAQLSNLTGTPCSALPCDGTSNSPLIPTVQDTQTCKFGAIWTTDSTTGPDELYVTYASGAVVTRLHQAATFDPSLATSIKVANSTGILPGDYLLVTDQNQGTVVQVSSTWVNTGDNVAGTTVTLVAPTCATISCPNGPCGGAGAGYADGSLVIRVYRAHFFIEPTKYSVPTLMMDPDSRGSAACEAANTCEPLAENIEDMQIALGIDADNSGSIDANEWAYSLSNPGTVSQPGQVRAVRITLTAKAPQALIGNAAVAAFQYKGAENRLAGGFDAYRRRVLTSTIEVRNTRSGPPGGAR